MAIDKAEFELIAQNLYIQKDYIKNKPTKFLFDFKHLNRRYRKVITIDRLAWDKRQRIEEAKKLLASYKDEVKQGKAPTKALIIEQLWHHYYKTLDPKKKWTYQQQHNYKNYVAPYIGLMRVRDVKPLHIDDLIAKLRQKGLRPRTQKLALNVLKPLYRFALVNQLADEDPTRFITIKIPPQKKIVINASDKLRKVYNAITTVFKDDPYYQALFLFGFTGRRKSEVLTLKWANIDLINGYYWLDHSKSNQHQRYSLPNRIKELLIDIPDGDKNGYVFKSPLNPKMHLKEFRAQMRRLKEYTGIKELTFHYLRNILVSALAEKGLDTPYLSGVLGHTDITTINKYLTNNTLKSSQEAYKLIDEVVGTPVG